MTVASTGRQRIGQAVDLILGFDEARESLPFWPYQTLKLPAFVLSWDQLHTLRFGQAQRLTAGG